MKLAEKVIDSHKNETLAGDSEVIKSAKATSNDIKKELTELEYQANILSKLGDRKSMEFDWSKHSDITSKMVRALNDIQKMCKDLSNLIEFR